MVQSPVKHEPLAYRNGEFLPLSQLGVSVFDTGFLQGVTVVEQLRTFGGKLFRLDLHLARLARSLEIVGIDPGLPLAELGKVADELVEKNCQLLDPSDDQQATIFVTTVVLPAYAKIEKGCGQ